MKLIIFSVSNFRSITRAHRIQIREKTILVGKNNEGKSNLLKAMNIAMNMLLQHSKSVKVRRLLKRYRSSDERNYYWDRDYPILSQHKQGEKKTTFRLEFELTDDEIIEFKKEIGSSINGTLPLEIKIGIDNTGIIKVAKKGPGASSLNKKSIKIAEFIADRISINYIPAVRTDQSSLKVIREMLSEELSTLEDDEEYQKALNTIADLQKPILEKIATSIQKPLTEFLPSIKSVEITISDEERKLALRRDLNVIIDDGTPTNIEYKGEGIKSLAALGLLKDKSSNKEASVIIIEEPESHLHPEAIHQLNEVLDSLALKNQVIISTHNPLFVERKRLNENIIIDSGKAKSAKNISEIRNILGIKASDNLMNASYILLTEGEDDKIALEALFSILSKSLQKAITQNLLVIEPVGGAGNISYKLSSLKNTLCSYHVLLDNDKAGKISFEKAKKDNLLNIKNTTFINCKGMSESEFEDCLDTSLYEKMFLEEYGVSIKSTDFRIPNKWSDRVKNVFLNQGKPWNESIEKEVKFKVAEAVKEKPHAALNLHKRNSIDSLITSLEMLISI